MLSTLYLVGSYGMTFIQTATTGILITHRHNSCDGDACGDASSYHHHRHHPAMVRKCQQINTNFNTRAFIRLCLDKSWKYKFGNCNTHSQILACNVGRICCFI